MKKMRYLRLQIKRGAKLYPAVLLITVITLLAVGLTAAVLLANNAADTNKQKTYIGVVNQSGESYVDAGLFALRNLDNARFSFEFIDMEEAEARQKLERQEIAGYVILPEGYVNAIHYGRNIPATYVTIKRTTGFGSVLTGELTELISGIVTETQAAIYSMEDVAVDYGENVDLNAAVDRMNLVYLDAFSNRAQTYRLDILGIKDSVSMPGYYICGMMTFFLFLWGIAYGRLLTKRDYALYRVMAMGKYRAFSQVVAEYSAFFLFTLLTMGLLVIGGCIVLATKDIGVAELRQLYAGDGIRLTFYMIPVIWMIGLFQMAIYELVSGTVGAVLAQFFVALGCAYVSGFFYPSYFFPEGMKRLGEWLPSGVGFSYLRKSLTHTLSFGDGLLPLLYAACFLLLTVYVRQRKIRGSRI